MATKTNDAATTKTDAKPNKPKKEPVSAAKRIEDQLRRAVITNKITKEELTKISERATALTGLVS